MSFEELEFLPESRNNAVHTTTVQSHSTTALVQLILTCLLVKDDVFAEQVVVAQNYRGAQHRQVLLEPQQLFSEAPWAGHLCSHPARGNRKM